ncbi:MAG: CHASE2 domain-containing protein [Magnetococcales bacterium]|nr:CHASE2 domain-containing protein [Magnetococcales bacterium]
MVRWDKMVGGYTWGWLMLVLLLALLPLPRRGLEQLSFDIMQRHAPREYPWTLPLRVAAIDEASLRRHGQWPWPRSRLAKMLDRLRADGARVIVVDLLFPEPDRISPGNLAALWPGNEDWRRLLDGLPDQDRRLADSMSKAATVLGFAPLVAEAPTPLPTEKAGFIATNADGDGRGQWDVRRTLTRYTGSIVSLPLFQKVAQGQGAISMAGSDPDGMIRHIPLVYHIRSGLYPALGLETLRVMNGLKLIQLATDPFLDSAIPALTGVSLGGTLYPTGSDSQIWLHYRHFNPYRYLSAQEILDKDAEASLIKDHLVFLGVTAKGVGDHVATPLGEIVPGVEVHMQVVEQLLQKNYLLRPWWENLVVGLWLIVAWFVVRALMRRGDLWWLLGFNGFMALVLVQWAFWLFVHQHLLVDPVYPIVAMVLLSSSLLLPHLLQLEKNRLLIQAKSAFIANVSHELRTPMTAVLGLTDLCLRTRLDQRQKDYLTKVQAAGKTLLQIINDLLDISRMEAGRLTLETVPYSLDQVLTQVAAMTQVKGQEKGLKLEFCRDPDLPPQLLGDPLRLGQVLLNLVNNAVKFTPSGRVVTLLRLHSRQDQQVEVKISVRDEGIGMTAEQQGVLFQAFSQVDASIARQFGGTGLGLAICRELVAMMGGRIWVESALNVGSTFHCTLTQKIDPQRQESEPLPAPLQGERVLVVNEGEETRDMVVRYLTAWGLSATGVADARAALEAVTMAAPPWSLVLVDETLSDMSGVQLAQRLRQWDRGPVPMRIMLLGGVGPGVLELERLPGVDQVVPQPLTPPVLYRGIMKLFGLAGGEWEQEQRRKETPDGETPPGLAGRRALLAEDNGINQQIVCELLHQAGMEVVVANDGREALERLCQREFDVVLMDVQMPVLDGYSAAWRIRRDDRIRGDLPIIAMTANAEDRSRIEESGMNGYVAKPIDPQLLYDALGECLQLTSPGICPPRSVVNDFSALKGVRGMDLQTALVRVGGNQELLRRLLHHFMEQHAGDPERLRQAVGEGDDATARRLAHTLKGIAGSLGAQELQQVAINLESALERADRRQTTTLVEELGVALTALMAALAEWSQGESDVSHPVPKVAPKDRDHLVSLSETLERQLRQHNPDALDTTDELLHYYGVGDHEPLLSLLRRQVASFDFDDARETFSRILPLLATIEP